ncbi:SDR family oxidoreductase [Marinobacter salicampi]|uniref:SDR family oxidoreductase n=1 Tax=Marinobacter salicampi TaxID=435907 RepID=UPI00140DF833|nr:SDR family oxidoreductase [Marinobacter salicampi]
MAKGISNKVVVITGASSGIGYGTALKCASAGAALVLTARRSDALEEVSRECAEKGAEVLVVAGDVADLHHVEEVGRKAIEEFGRIDVWVNNAGVAAFGRLEEVPYRDYRRVIETNLFGYIHGARVAIPAFREQGQGILINVSSVVGHIGAPFASAYSISKWGVEGLTESLRMELQDAPEIKICSVLPPSTDTPFFSHAANFSGQAIKPLDPVHSTDLIVEAIVDLMKNPKREVLPGSAAKQLNFLRSFAPSLAERLFGPMAEHRHFQDRPALDTHGNVHEPIDSRVSVDDGWLESSATYTNPGYSRERSAFIGAALLGLGISLATITSIRNHQSA